MVTKQKEKEETDELRDLCEKRPEEPEDRPRPKRGENVKFTVIGETDSREGRVIAVGKPSGRDKFRCWIQERKKVSNWDFVNEIEVWQKNNKVEFNDNIKVKQINQKKTENAEVVYFLTLTISVRDWGSWSPHLLS